MPTTQKDFDAFKTALKNNYIEDVKELLQNFDVTATDENGSTCFIIGCQSSSPEVVKLVFDKILEAGGKVLLKRQLTTADRFGRTCLMAACASSSSPAVVKLLLGKIDEAGDPDLLRSQLSATNSDGRTCLMLACRNSSSPEVVKLVFKKIVESGDIALLKSQLTATDNNGWTCLMLALRKDSSFPEVMKLLAVVLFYLDLFKEQYLDYDSKNKLKKKTGIGSFSWIPDAASLAEVKESLPQSVFAAIKKKAEEKRKAQEEKKMQGNEAFAKQQYYEAISLYTSAIEIAPELHSECSVIYSNRAGCYQALQNYHDALLDAGSCIESFPEWFKGYFRKGKALKSLGNDEAAGEAFEMALQMDPESIELQLIVKQHKEGMEKKAEEEAAAAKKKAEKEAALAEKRAEAEPWDIFERKKAEEQAAAKKKAEGEAAAKKKAEEEAATKKKAEEEAAAKKKAGEEAALAKKKAEEEAAAKEGKKNCRGRKQPAPGWNVDAKEWKPAGKASNAAATAPSSSSTAAPAASASSPPASSDSVAHLQNLLLEFSAMKRDQEKHEQRIRSVTGEKNKYQADAKRLKEQLAVLAAKRDANLNATKLVQSENLSTRAKLAEEEKRTKILNDDLVKAKQDFDNFADKQQSTIAILRNHLASEKRRADEVTRERDGLGRRAAASDYKITQLTALMSATDDENKALRKENEALEHENEVLTENCDKATQMYKSLSETNIRALEGSSTSTSKMKALKKEKEELERKTKQELAALSAESESAKKESEQAKKEKEEKEKDLEIERKEKEKLAQEHKKLAKEIEDSSPKKQILSQYDELCKFATAEVDKLHSNNWLSSTKFHKNQCLQDECPLLDKITASEEASFKRFVKKDAAGKWELSGQFELAFHGTADTNALKILCEGFDPRYRGRIGQKYGPGEYFGEFTQHGLQTAQGYVQGALLLVLFIKAAKVNRPGNSMIIIDNPLNAETFCLPLGVYFTNKASAPTRQCGCAVRAATARSGRSTQRIYPSALSQTYTKVQFQDDNGQWADMSSTDMTRILSHYNNNKMAFSYKSKRPNGDEFQYDVDLNKMEQTNTQTNRVRLIRFV